MKLWIFLAFAVLCRCNAQNEDSLGLLPDGWDDYDDQWYNGDFDEAAASKEILDEDKDVKLPLDASDQDLLEDLPLDETDKRVDEEIQKFLQETKDENIFKDYLIEDNRSGNQEESKSIQNSPVSHEDTMSAESKKEDNIKIDLMNDGEPLQVEDVDMKMSLLKPNYETDLEIIDEEKSAEDKTKEINDSLTAIDDGEMVKLFQEMSAEIEKLNVGLSSSNEGQDSLKLSKEESADEEIPSAPEVPIEGYEEVIKDATRILKDTEGALDEIELQEVENESNRNDQQEPKEKLGSIDDDDSEMEINEIDLDKAIERERENLQVNKRKEPEIKITEADLQNILQDNPDLDKDLTELFGIDAINEKSKEEIEDFDISEVDFDKLFEEIKSSENKTAQIVVKASPVSIVQTREMSLEEKDDNITSSATIANQIVRDTTVQPQIVDKQLDRQVTVSNNDDEEDDESTVQRTTKVNKVTSKKVEELTSSEFENLLQQFTETHQDEFDFNSKSFNKEVAPIHIQLSASEIETVTSPGYPSPYPTNNIIDWVFEGNGTGIELNITDFDVNGALGDYLLIKPGSIEDYRRGLIVTHHLSKERRYRFLSTDKLFIRFEAKQGMAFKKGFSFNIKMIFPPTDEDLEDVPEAPILPPTPHTLTVNLGGVTLPQFLQMKEDFRILVADMATLYINANGIEVENTTLSVTQLLATTLCNVNWPGVENCVEVRFAVPVLQDELNPRLNEADLQAMWYTYVYQDPFAARLTQMGISGFSVPNARAILSVWLVIGAGVLVSMTMLAFVLWRYSCVEDYTRMQNMSDAGSFGGEKRPLDLYPTPHQTLPPLYSDTYKYPYGDTATVTMDGVNNQGYAQDNIFDIDSDDEAVKRERNQSSQGISARDIYNL